MISDESILRRLPEALNAEQRLQLEALVFAADAAMHGMETIWQISAGYGQVVDRISARDRVTTLVAAWSIVDQVHVARQLLQRMITGDVGPELSPFMQTAATATAMRNAMDHLHTNIPNLAKAKGPRAPIFGSLAYLLVAPEDVDQTGPEPRIRAVKTVVMMTGAVVAGVSAPVINPGGRMITVPVSNFELTSPAGTLSLSDAASQFATAVAFVEEQCTHMFPLVAAELAAAQGRPVEDYLTHPAAGLTLIMGLTAVDPGDGSSG